MEWNGMEWNGMEWNGIELTFLYNLSTVLFLLTRFCLVYKGRIKDVQQSRVLDLATRRIRQRRALHALEADNFQDDPHSDLKMSKKAPKFEETTISSHSSKLNITLNQKNTQI